MKKHTNDTRRTRPPAIGKPRAVVMRSATALLLMAALDTYAANTITDLGTLPGHSSYALAVSADGSVVVTGIGMNVIGGPQYLFKYTDSGNMVDLGALGGKHTYTNANAISADGSTIVGRSYISNIRGPYYAFKYTDQGGMVSLGTLGGISSIAMAVSADGSTIVGAGYTASASHAFKYTDQGGMVDLGTLGGISSSADVVSADGSTIAGSSYVPSLDGYHFYHAFKYTDQGGMVDLGTLGGSTSDVYGISADGSVVVGNSRTANNNNNAYKYTDVRGMVSLGTLGGDYSLATAVSADGSVVVGGSSIANSYYRHAYKHTDARGMVDLGTLGGAFSEAIAVSADGSVVVGRASTANGWSHAYRHTDGSGMVDLGTLGGEGSTATGVSADGKVIVGAAETTNGELHAVLWKSSTDDDSTIVDVDNTRTALAQTAQQASQVIDMRSAQLQMLMQQDCSAGTGDGRLCIGAGAVYSGSSNARDTAASFTLGYQIAPQWRIGTTINQSLDNTLPSEYKSSNNLPGIGVFSTFNARKDGLGWQARVAAAYQKSKLDINRKQLSYTEGGIGRADLDGKAAAVEGSYRMRTHNDVIVAPYAALRYSSVRRSAYNESNDVAFVGRYGEMGRSATSIDAGLRVAKTINSKLSLSADIGVIRDIAVNNRGFAVTMNYVGGFALGNGDDERTRAHLGVQGSYALAKDSAIQGGIYWAQQAYGNDSGSAQIRLIRQF